MARRSVLFTPGDRTEMLASAAETDADVLVFDLEDGVTPDRRADARETVVEFLRANDIDTDASVYVRVNPVTGSGTAVEGRSARPVATAGTDVAALEPVADAIDGVVVPKVEAGSQIRSVAAGLRRRGVQRRVFALVETATGVEAAPGIADAGATDALVFGAEDLAADLGATRTGEGREVSGARERVLTAARASGVDAIDTLWTKFEDVEGLRVDARRAAEAGFDGKLAIHPSQIGPINDAFTPEPDRLAWAERVLEASEVADAEGRGAFAVDGEMIDAPLVTRARRVVERARAAGAVDDDRSGS